MLGAPHFWALGFLLCVVTSNQSLTILYLEKECNDTDIQLVNGQTSLDGRVEVCHDHLWIPVCSDSWDNREAEVVCTQLGYQESKA